MKRILVILLLMLFIGSTDSFATFFIDGFGAYVNAGDMKNQIGGGAGLGFDVTSNLNFLFRTAYSTVTENLNEPDEITFTHNTILAGVEFIPYIQQLQDYRLSWKTSLLAGVASSEGKPESGDGASETGAACSIWTGMQYDLTQNVSPFFDLGYHKSFYNSKLDGVSVQGYQIALGIRFYITGNRDFTGEYQ